MNKHSIINYCYYILCSILNCYYYIALLWLIIVRLINSWIKKLFFCKKILWKFSSFKNIHSRNLLKTLKHIFTIYSDIWQHSVFHYALSSKNKFRFYQKIFRCSLYYIENRLVGCRLKANSPYMGPVYGMPFVGVFLRGPSPYLREFRRKPP